MKDEIVVCIIIASLIFGFNLGELKNRVTKEFTQALRESWKGNLYERNIF